MKISPFTVTETRFSFRKSVKKVVPFLVVGLMLAAGNSVSAYSGEMARLHVGMIILFIIKMGARRLINGGCILVSVLLLQPFV